MYIIKTLQDLEPLLDDITLQEGEALDEVCINAWNEKRSQQGYTGYSEDEDKLIIPAKGGKWFQHDIQVELYIYGGDLINSYLCPTKIKPEDRQKVKNTIAYIQEHFDQIYEALLNALLPSLKEWNMQNKETGAYVETIEQLHMARDKRLDGEYFGTSEELQEIKDSKRKNAPETGCLHMLQLNCAYQKDDTVFYSFGFMPDCYLYGYDDGMEIVFCKDQVISFTDGYVMDHIFQFKKYPGIVPE